MVQPDVRARLPLCLALCSLIFLSALVISSSRVSSVSSASAALAHSVLVPAVLAVSPTNLTNCRQCVVIVINESPNRNLSWFAFSHGIPGVTINPGGGTLQPKGRGSVSITVPSNTLCPANDTITFNGPANLVKVSWSCVATPTPTPTLAPTPTSMPSLTPTPIPPTATAAPSPTPSASQTNLTPTPSPVPGVGGHQDNGNTPGSGGSQGGSVPSILLSVAALLIALLAFTLFLMPATKASFRNRLLALILPVSFLRKFDQNQRNVIDQTRKVT